MSPYKTFLVVLEHQNFKKRTVLLVFFQQFSSFDRKFLVEEVRFAVKVKHEIESNEEVTRTWK